jgi:hypothetical protein
MKNRLFFAFWRIAGAVPCIVALLIVLTFLPGCTQGKPLILSTDVKLLRVQGPAGLFSERLSLFVLEKDADGPEDFGSITLTQKATGLAWTITSAELMVTTKGQDRWIGSNALAASGDAPFPSGQYTVTLSDLAGNENIQSVMIARPQFPDTAPVKFSVADGNWVLERNPSAGEFRQTWFFLLDGQSRVLQSWKVPDSEGPTVSGSLESLQMMAMQAVSVQCYTENTSATAGVLLIPVDLR